SLTSLSSKQSCKLLGDVGLWTSLPTLALKRRCVSATSFHTSPCCRDSWTATFKPLLTTELAEQLNCPVSSPPRFCHRPCSTQNEGNGNTPDFVGTTRS